MPSQQESSSGAWRLSLENALRPLARVQRSSERPLNATGRRISNGRNGAPELGIHPTGPSRPDLWRSSGVVDYQHLLEAQPGTSTKRWRVPQITGTDLEEETAAGVAVQCLRIYEVAKTTVCNNCDTSIKSCPKALLPLRREAGDRGHWRIGGRVLGHQRTTTT